MHRHPGRVRPHPHRRRRSRVAALSLAISCFAAGALIRFGATPMAAGTTTISITSALPLLKTCAGGGAGYCFSPNPAGVVLGDRVTWVDNQSPSTGHHLHGQGRNTLTIFDVNFASCGGASTCSGSLTPTAPDTYDYTDTTPLLGVGSTGTLVVAPAPTPPPSTAAGSSAGVNLVTGAGAGKPVIVAATPGRRLGTVTQPRPQGSTALPPLITTPDPAAGLPPITTLPPTPQATSTPRALGTTPTSTTGGGRSTAFYVVGGLLFALVAAGGGGFYGFKWWRQRRVGGPAEG